VNRSNFFPKREAFFSGVADLDPDPYVFGPPGSPKSNYGYYGI